MSRDYAAVHARKRANEMAAKAIMGGRCVRCGITEPLDWDHINDDAPESSTHSASGLRRRPGLSKLEPEFNSIRKTGKSDLLQLLCCNCNQLKRRNRAAFDLPPIYGMLNA